MIFTDWFTIEPEYGVLKASTKPDSQLLAVYSAPEICAVVPVAAFTGIKDNEIKFCDALPTGKQRFP